MKTKIAAEFRDRHEAWNDLFKFLVTPRLERPSLEEFGGRLAWLADRSTPYNVDDVKYRLVLINLPQSGASVLCAKP